MTPSEADELLAEAIRQHAHAYDLSPPDELLSDFGVVAHWQAINDDGNDRYTTHFHRNGVPGHIARGLFLTGLRAVNQDDYEEDEASE